MKRILIMLCIMFVTTFANAKTYKVFVGTPPGSGSDIQTRKLFDEVSKETGDTFIVLNKPGANFVISYNAFLEEVKNGNPAILFNATTLSIAMSNRGESLDLKGLIALHKVHYYVAVLEQSSFKSINDLKKTTIGSTSLVSEILIKSYLNNDNVIVPYKSENDSTLALMKGEVAAISTNSVNSILVTQSEKFRIINAYPENVVGITGYSVSKDFSESERKSLNAAMNKVVQSVDFKSWIKSTFNVSTEGGSPNRYDELNDKMLDEIYKRKK